MTTTEHSSPTLVRMPKTSTLIRIIAILLVLALVFWAGIAVGYHKAEFSYRFSDNYFRTFGNGRMNNGGMGFGKQDELTSGHGTAGKVLSVSLPRIIVSDRDGTEKTITLDNNTIIRSARADAASTTIKADDFIVVIGSPDSTGQITAKFIRVMPSMMYPR